MTEDPKDKEPADMTVDDCRALLNQPDEYYWHEAGLALLLKLGSFEEQHRAMMKLNGDLAGKLAGQGSRLIVEQARAEELQFRLNSGIEILERWKAASVPGSNDWTGGPPEWALAALKATGSGTAPAGGGRNAEAAQSDFPTWVRCATPGCILVGGHQDRSSCTDKDFRTIAVERGTLK
jgi:hypothetical protein